jgi:hypothetical protein
LVIPPEPFDIPNDFRPPPYNLRRRAGGLPD